MCYNLLTCEVHRDIELTIGDKPGLHLTFALKNSFLILDTFIFFFQVV